MIVYIFGFSLSLLLIGLAQRYKTKDIRFQVLSFFALLIPCFIAGLRDLTIGTDVNVYASPMFDIAKSSSSLKSFLNTTWYMVYVKKTISDIEMGYDVLVFVTAKVFGSVQSLLFLTEMLVVVPVYVALVKMRKQLPIWVGMLTFYLMYFNLSLNIMRQSIAMAFLLLAFSYLFNESRKGFVVSFIIAVCFHTSAFLGIIVFAIYLYVVKDRKMSFHILHKHIRIKQRTGKISRDGTHKLILITAIGVFAIVFYQILISVLNNLGLSVYTRYLIGGVAFLPKQIVVRLPFILFAMMAWKVLEENTLSLFYMAMVIVDILLSQLAGTEAQTMRVSMFFGMFRMFFAPILYVEAPKKNGKIIRIGMIVYLLIYWLYYFVLKASGETYPYMFYF